MPNKVIEGLKDFARSAGQAAGATTTRVAQKAGIETQTTETRDGNWWYSHLFEDNDDGGDSSDADVALMAAAGAAFNRIMEAQRKAQRDQRLRELADAFDYEQETFVELYDTLAAQAQVRALTNGVVNSVMVMRRNEMQLLDDVMRSQDTPQKAVDFLFADAGEDAAHDAEAKAFATGMAAMGLGGPATPYKTNRTLLSDADVAGSLLIDLEDQEFGRQAYVDYSDDGCVYTDERGSCRLRRVENGDDSIEVFVLHMDYLYRIEDVSNRDDYIAMLRAANIIPETGNRDAPITIAAHGWGVPDEGADGIAVALSNFYNNEYGYLYNSDTQLLHDRPVIIVLDWNSGDGADNNPTYDSDEEIRDFRTAEFRAAITGQSLASLLDVADEFTDSSVAIFAHSMGNQVMMQAVQDSLSETHIDYFLSVQAAVPIGALRQGEMYSDMLYSGKVGDFVATYNLGDITLGDPPGWWLGAWSKYTRYGAEYDGEDLAALGLASPDTFESVLGMGQPIQREQIFTATDVRATGFLGHHTLNPYVSVAVANIYRGNTIESMYGGVNLSENSLVVFGIALEIMRAVEGDVPMTSVWEFLGQIDPELLNHYLHDADGINRLESGLLELFLQNEYDSYIRKSAGLEG